MTKHEFIFSDQRKTRLTRHLFFWIVWWFAYTLFFHVPVLELKGWGLSREAAPATFRDVQRIGAFLYSIKTFVFNSLLAVVLPQAMFTYVLLYWLLPNYFYKKRNPLIIAGVIVVILSVFRILVATFIWFVPFGNYIFGLSDKLPRFDSFTTVATWISLRQQLGSLPVLLGITIMIKLIKRWWQKHTETEQLAKEKAEAELQLLKAQVHPHFLFNTLNNIYFFTLSDSHKAAEMIGKLSTLLLYFLNECNRPLVLLEKELGMIKDYVSLEKIRYGDDLNIVLEVRGNCTNKMIAPLLLIPFVENCFKHGASKMLNRPFVELCITVENNTLQLFIRNSKPELPAPSKTTGKIGLKNVNKRLQLLYPIGHQLRISDEKDIFTVFLEIPLTNLSIIPQTDEAQIQVNEYSVV